MHQVFALDICLSQSQEGQDRDRSSRSGMGFRRRRCGEAPAVMRGGERSALLGLTTCQMVCAYAASGGSAASVTICGVHLRVMM